MIRRRSCASDRAELGMVAAAALGDVVEEGGDVEQPGRVEFAIMTREQSGYSWANSLIVKRRRLRSTCRMCWSTV